MIVSGSLGVALYLALYALQPSHNAPNPASPASILLLNLKHLNHRTKPDLRKYRRDSLAVHRVGSETKNLQGISFFPDPWGWVPPGGGFA